MEAAVRMVIWGSRLIRVFDDIRLSPLAIRGQGSSIAYCLYDDQTHVSLKKFTPKHQKEIDHRLKVNENKT